MTDAHRTKEQCTCQKHPISGAALYNSTGICVDVKCPVHGAPPFKGALQCDECDKWFTAQWLPIHKCEPEQ